MSINIPNIFKISKCSLEIKCFQLTATVPTNAVLIFFYFFLNFNFLQNLPFIVTWNEMILSQYCSRYTSRLWPNSSSWLMPLCFFYFCDTPPTTLYCYICRSAILNAGYNVSFSHACKNSVKTNAPNHVIWVCMLWNTFSQLKMVNDSRQYIFT